MVENPTRVCELLVGLGDVEVLGVDDEAVGSVSGAHPDAAPGCVWELRPSGRPSDDVGAPTAATGMRALRG